MTEYVIEKNVPMPLRKLGRRADVLTKTLISLDVGDSFLVKKQLRSRLSQIGKRAGKVFSARAVGDELRVWRIK